MAVCRIDRGQVLFWGEEFSIFIDQILVSMKTFLTVACICMSLCCAAQSERNDQHSDAIPGSYIAKPGTLGQSFVNGSYELASRRPLFVMNGVKMEVTASNDAGGIPREVADLPVNNIETISVVKGNEAIALYGPAGRNGVIIIKTKRS